ncbi:MAG: hypothetical protein LH609_05140, partial [Rudanella sp.]|nr:hypothetical protein [Rudanella sp.]
MNNNYSQSRQTRRRILTTVSLYWFVFGMMMVLASGAQAQISGTVFRDYNANGTRQITGLVIEQGVLGVTVRVFNAAGTQLASVTTVAAGTYSIPVGTVPANTPVRIEFSGFPAGTFVSKNGADNGTATQFATAPATAVDLGILSQTDLNQYVGTHLYTSCYVNGDPTVSGSQAAAEPGIIQMGYYNFDKKVNTNLDKVGAIWGLAYSQTRNRLYSAAVVRRHAGFGPGGIGAIYVQNPDQPASVATLTTLSAGTLTNSNRGLTSVTTLNGPNTDVAGFAGIGKQGLGDIDLSSDENTLYVVNLSDRQLYRVGLNAAGTATGAATAIALAPWLSAGCTGSITRPWGIKVVSVGGSDRVYVGVVCDASTSATVTDLRARVYEYNVGTSAWHTTAIIDFSLNYNRQQPGGNNPYGATFKWKPWTDIYATMKGTYNTMTQVGGYDENTGAGGGNYAQPILS